MPGFSESLWLCGLIIIPLLFAYYLYHKKRRQVHALEFSKISYIKEAQKGSKKKGRQWIIPALFLAALALIITGLAGPHIPLENIKTGANVVFAVDISGSMLADDYKPDRLESAKESVEIMIENLDKKDYAGVVTFEAGASSTAYLSPDKDRILLKLSNIKSKGGNTAIGDGLALAVDMAVSVPGRKAVVILLSDGENNAGYISPGEAISFAVEKGVQVFTVGVGSDTPVIYDYDMLKNPLYAVLDEEILKGIAEETGGKYFRSVNETTLKDIYENLSGEINRETEETDISWIFFLFAGFTVLAAFILQYGRKGII